MSANLARAIPIPQGIFSRSTPNRRVESPAARDRRAARDRARKLARKDNRTPEQKQAAALAALIREQQAEFPALRFEINEFLYVLHQRVAETEDRVRDSVVQMLKLGPATMEDFLDELKFSELVILNVLEALRALGQVREVPRGRTTQWQLTGNKATTDQVLP